VTRLSVTVGPASDATELTVRRNVYQYSRVEGATTIEGGDLASNDLVDRIRFFHSGTVPNEFAENGFSDADTRPVDLGLLGFWSLLALLRARHLGHVADRLDDLHELVQCDPDVNSIDTVSVQQMVGFMLSHPDYSDAGIGITLEGFVHLEWKLPQNGRVVMKFTGSGTVRIVVMSRLIGVKASFPVRGEYSFNSVFDVAGPWLERKQ